MSQRKEKNRIDLAVIALPEGVRLYSEDYYLEALAPLGVSRRGLRAWFRALQVPTKEIGNTKFVDPQELNLALKAVMRIGQPDFFCPGSKGLRRGNPPGATTLDATYFKNNISLILAEVIAARTRPNQPAPEKVRRAARLAAERMSDMGLQALPTAMARRNALLNSKRQGLREFTDG